MSINVKLNIINTVPLLILILLLNKLLKITKSIRTMKKCFLMLHILCCILSIPLKRKLILYIKLFNLAFHHQIQHTTNVK